jgi:hypothetical protein
MDIKRLSKLVLLYFILIFGYFMLFSIDIENILYPENTQESKSTVDFVYQKF